MAIQIQEEIKVFAKIHKSISMDGSMAYSPAASLISLCFKASMKAHFAHLQTHSYSEHKALDTFYTNIITLTDDYAESYQGKYGIIDTYPHIRLQTHCGLHIVETVRDWINENRMSCRDTPELQNSIDNIITLCNSTIYQITNLK